MTHILDLLINTLVIAVALLLVNWLATNASSPLMGKI